MALTKVEITNIGTKAYAKQMIEEFLDGEYQAAIVDPAENATAAATATQLRNVIKEQKLEDKLVCQVKKDEIRLILAELL